MISTLGCLSAAWLVELFLGWAGLGSAYYRLAYVGWSLPQYLPELRSVGTTRVIAPSNHVDPATEGPSTTSCWRWTTARTLMGVEMGLVSAVAREASV